MKLEFLLESLLEEQLHHDFVNDLLERVNRVLASMESFVIDDVFNFSPSEANRPATTVS